MAHRPSRLLRKEQLWRQGCLSYPGWVPIHLLSPMNASCPKSNASSKTQYQHDWFAGNQWFCFQHTLPQQKDKFCCGEKDLTAMCPRHTALLLSCPVLGCQVPPFAQPYNCSRRKSIPFPRIVPHTCCGTLCFFLSQDGGFRGCACCIFNFRILKEFSSAGLVMPLSQACGAPSEAHEQRWWEQPWEQDSQRYIHPWILFSRAGALCLTLTHHSTGDGKIPLSWKAVDPASTREAFQRQLKLKKSHSSLLVIMAVAAATADYIHHSLPWKAFSLICLSFLINSIWEIRAYWFPGFHPIPWDSRGVYQHSVTAADLYSKAGGTPPLQMLWASFRGHLQSSRALPQLLLETKEVPPGRRFKDCPLQIPGMRKTRGKIILWLLLILNNDNIFWQSLYPDKMLNSSFFLAAAYRERLLLYQIYEFPVTLELDPSSIPSWLLSCSEISKIFTGWK